jgi:PIN domain nuclease of toxin-antitoxin system
VKYLIDTHTLWHHASDGDGLSEVAANGLDGAPVGDLLVLDVALYELARHMAVGRIEVESPGHTLSIIERSYPLLHSDAEIAWKAASLDWPKRRGGAQHLDPADRAIMAAAIIHKLTIITADKEMHHYAAQNGVRVLW